MAEARRVIITFDQDGNLVATGAGPTMLTPKVTARKDDKIRWESPHGTVRVNFNGKTPFGGTGEVAGGKDHAVTVEEGLFKYDCGVTVGNKHFGWPDKTKPGSGGEVEIVRRQ